VTYISQLERGLKSPSLATLMLLGAALGTAAAELVAATEQVLGATSVTDRSEGR
jgi:transcriptional regulator with XRE-family HTH domain